MNEYVIEKLINGLAQFKGFYSQDYYLEFEDRILSLKEKVKSSLVEGRLLKIGIVGEVKAGKSSFLNSLIFDGADVLPKASTPMTAALTKITYANESSAKIVFYSTKDWERVEKFAQEYDQQFEKLYDDYLEKYQEQQKTIALSGGGYSSYKPPKTKEEMKRSLDKRIALRLVSCKELTVLSKKSSIDLYEYLDKELTINFHDIKSGLNDYIGSDGQYTAIVKHVELQINNELLKDVEIVDTPGLNDPIISRGETTKQFLRECDVIFLLSYCGQFLTQEDISFMCETLPNEGIRNVVLIGSKFDSGILDNDKAKDVKTACNSSKMIYDGQARENIDKCLNSNYNLEILKRIKNSLPPNYVSSILFSCAVKRKKGVDYSAQEKNIIDRLKEQFCDFQDDYKTLLSLSGIIQIKRDKLSVIMQQKQKIIEERNREIVADNKKFLLKILEDINIQAIQNKEDLQNYDKDKLEKKLHMLQVKLNSMRREIRNIFESSAVEAESFLNKIAVNIDREIDNYIDFDVSEKTDIKHGSYRTGFLGLKKEHYTETITTYSASVSDVISNMRGYISRCKAYSNEEFEKIINLKNLENKVKDTVIGAFDLSGKDFNENDILIPLEIVIKRIKIPKIDIEVKQFEPMILNAFSGATVKGEEIHQLKLQENKVLGEISKAIKEELRKCHVRIENVMLEQSSTFVDNIIEQLTENIEMLRKQIDNKENSIRQYDTLCKTIVEYKQIVSEMEM